MRGKRHIADSRRRGAVAHRLNSVGRVSCVMLYEFLTAYHRELVHRCNAKVAERLRPAPIPIAGSQGVPLFLQQVADTLRTESLDPARNIIRPDHTPTDPEIRRAAGTHGSDLLRQGFSVDEVVHEYGDVCQSVTDLAVEENVEISADEFRTFNRCLDNAIAEAVASCGLARQVRINDQADDLHTRLGEFADEYSRLVEVALDAFSAIKAGHVGVSGATGLLLFNTLTDLRCVTQRWLPEIRLASATTTLTSSIEE